MTNDLCSGLNLIPPTRREPLRLPTKTSPAGAELDLFWALLISRTSSELTFPWHHLLIEAVWAEAARASTSSQPRAHTSKRETTKRAASTSRTMTTPGGRGRPRRSRHAFITSTARVDCPLLCFGGIPTVRSERREHGFRVRFSRTVCPESSRHRHLDRAFPTFFLLGDHPSTKEERDNNPRKSRHIRFS